MASVLAPKREMPSVQTAARNRTHDRPDDGVLRDLVETAGVGIHLVGQTGVIEWANAADHEPLGFTADEYVGRNIAEFHADADVISDILARLSRGERLSHYPARLRCKDGSLRHVLISSSVRFSSDGRFLHTRCFTVDVTERAELERKLSTANQRLQLALDAGRMGTWEWDMTTSEVTWSTMLESIHGMERGSFARTLEAYRASVYPEDLPRVLATVEEIVRCDAGEGQFEHRIVKADGEIGWVECQGKLIRDADSRPLRLLGVSRDITARKQEEILAAQQAEELRAVGEFRERFLGIAAHDLRGPLNTIVTASHLLLTSEALPEGLSKTVGRIARASDRMGRMITDLFDFTRGRLAGGIPVVPVEMDMGDVAEKVIDEVLAADPKSDVVLGRHGALRGQWDGDRVAQVVANLITNALRHGQGKVRVLLEGKADRVVMRVHNHGEPIPPDAIATLFDPFRRASPSSDGLGLGLYIVSEIVKSHGGTVQVSSSREQGTTFEVAWPRR